MPNEYDIPINLEIECPKCKSKMAIPYTQEDFLNNETLLFTCECGYSEKIETKPIIDGAMDVTEDAVVDAFNDMFKDL